MPLAVKVDTLCRKSSAPKRLSAVSAAANITSSVKKSDSQQRKSKINQLSREELDEMLEESRRNYEACKSIKEDFDRSFNMDEISGAQKKARARRGVKANDQSGAGDQNESTTKKGKREKSVAKGQTDDDEEVSQITSQKSELNSSGSDLRTSNDTLDSSGLSSPISLDLDLNADQSMSQEKIEYYLEIKTIDTITILADSTNTDKCPNDLQLITYIVHKLRSFYDDYKQFKSRPRDDQGALLDDADDHRLKLSIFDIAKLVSPSSDDSSSPRNCLDSALRAKLNEQAAASTSGDDNESKQSVDIQFADSLPDALRTELVISLIQPKEFRLADETLVETHETSAVDLFEELLFASSLEGLKFISFGKLSFENVVFYHYYFKDNKGLFIEAPVCCHLESPEEKNGDDASAQPRAESSLKSVRIYTACVNHSFFYSVKYLLDAIAGGKKNVVFKNSKLGAPSNLAAAAASQFVIKP